MSVLGEAEAAVETATGTGWVRIALRLAPYIAIALLAVALMQTRTRLRELRLQDRATLALDRQHDAEAIAANSAQQATAFASYASRIAAREPLVVHSTDTVTQYAQTPAGHALCLDADRVRGLDALDASLVPATAAGGSNASVQPNAGAPPAGR